MRKIIIAAALVGTIIAGAVAPAFADTMDYDATVFGSSVHYVEQAIAAQGFDVVNVAEWGTRIQATVVDANGHKSLKYFDPDTLAQAN